MLRRLSRNWQGNTYNLLNRNCCHFCEGFCSELGCRPVPGWLNRAAAGAESALNFTDRVVGSVRSGWLAVPRVSYLSTGRIGTDGIYFSFKRH